MQVNELNDATSSGTGIPLSKQAWKGMLDIVAAL